MTQMGVYLTKCMHTIAFFARLNVTDGLAAVRYIAGQNLVHCLSKMNTLAVVDVAFLFE